MDNTTLHLLDSRCLAANTSRQHSISRHVSDDLSNDPVPRLVWACKPVISIVSVNP